MGREGITNGKAGKEDMRQGGTKKGEAALPV